MDPTLGAAVIGSVTSLAAGTGGWLLRRRNTSAASLTKALQAQKTATDGLEQALFVQKTLNADLENYAFDCRRMIGALDGRPPAWPDSLRYLNKYQKDKGNGDDDI